MNEDLTRNALLNDDGPQPGKTCEHFKKKIWFSSFPDFQQCLRYIWVLTKSRFFIFIFFFFPLKSACILKPEGRGWSSCVRGMSRPGLEQREMAPSCYPVAQMHLLRTDPNNSYSIYQQGKSNPELTPHCHTSTLMSWWLISSWDPLLILLLIRKKFLISSVQGH